MKLFSIQKIRKTVCVLVASVSLVGARGQNVNYITPYNDNSFNSKTIDLSRTVGSTAGQAGVSSGAANYSIPITTPPRPGGIPAPTLSINYSSFGGDGPLGLGWSISGISGIERVGKIRAHNNITEPICTSQDEFSWDGVRLKKVTGGINAVEHWNTENESFAEIISYRDNNNRITKWTITTKDGYKYFYGDVDGWYASNSTCENIQCNVTNGGYLAYYLDYIEFTNGNIRQYSYVFNNQRERLISEVSDDYGNIRFYYKDRSDKYSVYAAGSRIDKHTLLDYIEVKGINNQLVRKYNFKYSTDNINSFLSEVEESTVSNNKLNSTIFQYGIKEPILNLASNLVITNTRTDVVSHALETGDYNGDGISDLLVIESKVDYCTQAPCWHTYYSAGFHVRVKDPNSNNFNTMYTSPDLTDVYVEGSNKKDNHRSYFSGDFNGDGRDDILTHHIDYSDPNWPKLVSTTIWTPNWNASDFYQNISYAPSGQVPGKVIHYNSTNPNIGTFYHIGDFDGDGAMDILYILENTSSMYISYPKRGIYFRKIDYTPAYTNCNSTSIQSMVNMPFMSESTDAIDLDGDSRSELVFFWNWPNGANGSSVAIYKIADQG
ncbi:MAG: SpvB/TcaC N-terminal domain-containing protein, partial [Chitinophagales bacterium]